MTLKKTVFLTAGVWIVAISALHAWLNLDLLRKSPSSASQFRVGFIPVT